MYGLRGIPHIIAEGNTSLVGELYLVDEDDFWPIDEIEGGYDRLPIELEDGTQALAYFGEKSWSRGRSVGWAISRPRRPWSKPCVSCRCDSVRLSR